MKYLNILSIGWLGCIIAIAMAFKKIDIVSILIAVAVVFLSFALLLISKHKNVNNFFFVLTSIMLLISIIFVFINFFSNIVLDEYSITNIVYMIIMIVFAVVSKTAQPNSTFGIRTYYSLEYPKVWKKTHSFFSLFSTMVAPMHFSLIFFGNGWGRFWAGTFLVLLPCIVSALYSQIIGSKYKREHGE